MTQGGRLIAVATYNEIDNLPSLVDTILHAAPAADILVVDDNSPDGTGCWCDERAASEPRLRCTHRGAKLGLGSATIEAMRAAIDGDYELLVTMDADWSHDPSFLPGMIAAASRADVVVGSRYCAGGTIEAWPLHRRLLSRWMNSLSRAVLRLPVRDTSGAFRVYRVAKLRELDFAELHSNSYAHLEEVLWQLNRIDARFVEVPITFRDRRGGRSKSGIRVAADKLATVFRLATRGGER
jgi:dolichol-phosphate mannosyltransferase